MVNENHQSPATPVCVFMACCQIDTQFLIKATRRIVKWSLRLVH